MSSPRFYKGIDTAETSKLAVDFLDDYLRMAKCFSKDDTSKALEILIVKSARLIEDHTDNNRALLACSRTLTTLSTRPTRP